MHEVGSVYDLIRCDSSVGAQVTHILYSYSYISREDTTEVEVGFRVLVTQYLYAFLSAFQASMTGSHVLNLKVRVSTRACTVRLAERLTPPIPPETHNSP